MRRPRRRACSPREDPAAASGLDACSGDADVEMGFTCSGAANPRPIALMIEKVSGCQAAGRRRVDLGWRKTESFQFLGKWLFDDGHLVCGRPGVLLADLGGEQMALLRISGCLIDFAQARHRSTSLAFNSE